MKDKYLSKGLYKLVKMERRECCEKGAKSVLCTVKNDRFSKFYFS